LAAYLGDSRPVESLLADRHAVADRLTLAQDIVEGARAGIDDDRARLLGARQPHDFSAFVKIGPLRRAGTGRERGNCRSRQQSRNKCAAIHSALRFWRLSTRSLTTAGSASVEVSPRFPNSSSAILRRMRRMILPERVLGRPGANWIL